MDNILKYVDMLPIYDDAAWWELSPEYRQDAFQDLGGIRCDIDFAKDKLYKELKSLEEYLDYLKDTLDSHGIPYKKEY